ncbi:S-adenosyl-L-methionine-dependent methyltransferase [Hypoxylon cercidicola]|nr:S-adenosyl-L-methionine-dependent methyltransferase [Hypoxylon cercidicola]
MIAPIRDKTTLNIRVNSHPPMLILMMDHRDANIMVVGFGFGRPQTYRHLWNDIAVGIVVIYPRSGEWRFEFVAAPAGPNGIRHQRPQLRVLELGCGPGLPVTGKLLSHPTLHVTANDISTAQISLARANLLGAAGNTDAEKRLALVEGDMAELAFPGRSFDAVVALYSLIHLPRAEQADMIGKIARWLKPGGYLARQLLRRSGSMRKAGRSGAAGARRRR